MQSRENCSSIGKLMLVNSHQEELPSASTSTTTYSTSLLLVSLSQSCTSLRQLKRIHGRLVRNNLNLNNLILAKMLRFAAVSPSGNLHYARLLFYHMLQPHQRNTFFYNTIIRGYAKSQTPSQSIIFFKEMRCKCVPPDEYTFTFLLKATAPTKAAMIMPFCGEDIHSQVLKFGVHSHIFIQNTLIHLYSTKGALAAAHRVFEETPTPDVVSWSGLLVGHVKAQKLDEARWIFERMPERDVVSWTAMLSGFAQAGRPREALELFQEMQTEGVRPDEVTMVGLISACTSLGDLEAGLGLHSYVEEKGFSWMVSLCNALIDMYSKCGCLEKAWGVFEKMEKRNLISWNSMIMAYAIHGTAKEAIGLFQRMTEVGLRPDGVTFLAVISACAHKGWVSEGRRLFESMQCDYGIEAGVEHYGCIVDMLGRAGQLVAAYDLITDMPIQSNDVVWGALLGACRIHGDADMGERVVKKLLQLKPGEGGYYILLCDIYIAAGRHAEAFKMRQTMKEMGAKKTPGCSRVGV